MLSSSDKPNTLKMEGLAVTQRSDREQEVSVFSVRLLQFIFLIRGRDLFSWFGDQEVQVLRGIFIRSAGPTAEADP